MTTSISNGKDPFLSADEPHLARQTRLRMGMPVTVAIALSHDLGSALHSTLDVERERAAQAIERVYAYFAEVDATFSPYRATSEVSRLNRGELTPDEISPDLREIFARAEATRQETQGYFDITRPDGSIDPSGIVKGWAIARAADLLTREGWRGYCVDAGGDMQVAGMKGGRPWRVGVRNPFNRDEHVKVLALSDCGIATSGTAARGQHIYDPHAPAAPLTEVASITVIAPSVYDADRMATAAFAMGRLGINFIASLPGYAGYMVDTSGHATYTSGFDRYVARP